MFIFAIRPAKKSSCSLLLCKTKNLRIRVCRKTGTVEFSCSCSQKNVHRQKNRVRGSAQKKNLRQKRQKSSCSEFSCIIKIMKEKKKKTVTNI